MGGGNRRGGGQVGEGGVGTEGGRGGVDCPCPWYHYQLAFHGLSD